MLEHICKMALHKGAILERAVRNSEYQISLLAKKLGKSRRHIYDLFKKSNVSLDILLQIGHVINYDFSNELKELIGIPENYKIDILNEPKAIKDSATYWKSKYLDLLEKHQLLLENKLRIYFEEKLE